MAALDDGLLRYYLDELSYLRHAGQDFASTYPKVAARLELQPGECPDPHVERLIESFAFLTARIQSDLDADFPEVAKELLDVLYPHYLRPVPSLAVARFDVDPERGKLTSGYKIPRDTPLFVHAERGAVCRLRTCYPVTLWPVEVTEAELETPDLYDFTSGLPDVVAILRLRLRSQADTFENLGVDRLRFHLTGDPVLVGRLYELLLINLKSVVIVRDGVAPFHLPPSAVRPVGFGEDEALLPYPSTSHPGYRLLQEYFAFPEKFHFVDLSGLKGRAHGKTTDVLFLLKRLPGRLPVRPDTFSLGCTPVVNLFEKTSEPIRIDHRQVEYRLVADMRREATTEIHSVISVSGSSDTSDPTRQYAPYYSFTHAMERQGQKAFWHSRRVPAQGGKTGTEILLSFCDLDFKPALPPEETVFARVLCTNRGMAAELPADETLLQTDEALPVRRIVCVRKPTRPLMPPLAGQALWRLVSHLSLNYLSLEGGEAGLRALREILGLYCFSDAPSLQSQIQGIRAITPRKVVRRMGDEAWKGFCRGTEITLTFDEAQYVGSSAFLLASVLNRFFALYASTNSFTQLVIQRTGREGEWKRWLPMAGAGVVL
ncbi:MAG TPA: type VI secretion system baseplate subunit TssF [Thermoanaerobaculia bacterium]|nr:type VI secretion system baseplate subunit TssF [Thermoanaerobaculia bacterium]